MLIFFIINNRFFAQTKVLRDECERLRYSLSNNQTLINELNTEKSSLLAEISSLRRVNEAECRGLKHELAILQEKLSSVTRNSEDLRQISESNREIVAKARNDIESMHRHKEEVFVCN